MTGIVKTDHVFGQHNPCIMFKSQRFEIVNAHRGRIVGRLTIRDITRPVVLEVRYLGQSPGPLGAINARFIATAKVSREDWGLEWNAPFETGGWLFGDEVKVNVGVEFTLVPDTAAPAGKDVRAQE